MKKLTFVLGVALSIGALEACTGPVECFRAINCVQACGGPVIQSGCSACPSGSFDNIVCVDGGTDSGTDVASPDASADAAAE